MQITSKILSKILTIRVYHILRKKRNILIKGVSFRVLNNCSIKRNLLNILYLRRTGESIKVYKRHLTKFKVYT